MNSSRNTSTRKYQDIILPILIIIGVVVSSISTVALMLGAGYSKTSSPQALTYNYTAQVDFQGHVEKSILYSDDVVDLGSSGVLAARLTKGIDVTVSLEENGKPIEKPVHCEYSLYVIVDPFRVKAAEYKGGCVTPVCVQLNLTQLEKFAEEVANTTGLPPAAGHTAFELSLRLELTAHNRTIILTPRALVELKNPYTYTLSSASSSKKVEVHYDNSTITAPDNLGRRKHLFTMLLASGMTLTLASSVLYSRRRHSLTPAVEMVKDAAPVYVEGTIAGSQNMTVINVSNARQLAKLAAKLGTPVVIDSLNKRVCTPVTETIIACSNIGD